ncbi:MAG: TOMM precursor leader peptide-binding protein [Nocardioidaceae bacterium]
MRPVLTRPILTPGTHVLRRGPHEVQLGLDPRHAVVLPDTEDVRASLRGLGSGTPADPDDPLLPVLAGHRLVVERGTAQAPRAPYAQAALARRLGDGAAQARELRAAARVLTTGFGHPAGTGLTTELGDLLAGAGVGTGPEPPYGVAALVGVGEPARELLDGWLRGGVPHVLVRLSEGDAVVGPFVLPGQTACLRCVDAHRTDTDPAWPLLVAQYAAASARDRADGTAEPVDPLLARLALAWAARDLATFVEGGRPSTWSATVTLGPDLGSVETRCWLRHPECGCTWT